MTTYNELVQRIQDIVEDDSTEFANDIPNQIKNTENRIFRYLQDLPVFRLTATGNFTAGVAFISKPSNFTRARTLEFTDASSNLVPLDRRTDQYLRDYWPNSSTQGEPKYYAETDEDNILVAPTPDSNYSYSLRYIRQPEGISSSNQSNWVSENCENVLLYGCLREACLFLEYPEQAANWDSKFQEEIALLKEETIRIYRTDYGA